jgi:DNA-binding transcriptional MerR regulator
MSFIMVKRKLEYTRKQLAEITGIPWNRVEFYQHQGLFEDVEPMGKGHAIKYSQRHVAEAAIIDSMSAVGVTLAKGKEVLKIMRTLPNYRNLFKKNDNVNPNEVLRNDGWSIYLLLFPDGDLDFVVITTGGANEHIEISMKDRKSAIVLDISEIFKQLTFD